MSFLIYHEVWLSNRKRSDSYVLVSEEIILKRITGRDRISEGTYRNCLSEIKKYKHWNDNLLEKCLNIDKIKGKRKDCAKQYGLTIHLDVFRKMKYAQKLGTPFR